MKKYILFSFVGLSSILFGQGGYDVEITAVGLRQVEPAYRMTESPKIIDTTIANPVIDFPLLVLQQPTKIEVEPYQYTIKETGEIITRNHRYEYVSEEEMILNENLIPLAEVN